MTPDEYKALAAKPARSKYGAKPCYRCLSCGADPGQKVRRCPYCQAEFIERFASLAEGRYYDRLRLRQHAGEITDLKCHPVWTLHARNGGAVCKVEMDFSFVVPGQGMQVVDVKGRDTDKSKLKRLFFEEEYKIPVQIVRA